MTLCMTKAPTMDDLKCEIELLLKANSALVDEHNALKLRLDQALTAVETLEDQLGDARADLEMVIEERDAMLKNNAPARLLREAVLEYRELVEEKEPNRYAWMGAESRLERALERFRV